MQNYHRAGGLTGSSVSIPTGRGKTVYILPSLDPTLALLLVGFTEYDDDTNIYIGKGSLENLKDTRKLREGDFQTRNFIFLFFHSYISLLFIETKKKINKYMSIDELHICNS
ncbi:hypothetical protein Hanom_Chr01g00058861 [Helianthus anomalus]